MLSRSLNRVFRWSPLLVKKAGKDILPPSGRTEQLTKLQKLGIVMYTTMPSLCTGPPSIRLHYFFPRYPVPCLNLPVRVVPAPKVFQRALHPSIFFVVFPASSMLLTSPFILLIHSSHWSLLNVPTSSMLGYPRNSYTFYSAHISIFHLLSSLDPS